MPADLINPTIKGLLERQEFINVATSDFNSRPNVAPKFLIKAQGDFIYLFDHVAGRTFQNLKINPRLSLSVVDMSTLIGYQLNVRVKIIEEGPGYHKLLDEAKRKEVDLSVKRLIEGVRYAKAHKTFEVEFPDRGVIFEVKIEEVVEIGTTGKLRRKKSNT
jgi:predicted pyridoxine 5'-phosphate oxidase superfamily flavin-nucleotide-binding protein